MNEPMHLVPRHVILNVMSLLEANGLTEDNDFAKQQHQILDRITEKKPDNLKEKI
jgi:hypothetical protein